MRELTKRGPWDLGMGLWEKPGEPGAPQTQAGAGETQSHSPREEQRRRVVRVERILMVFPEIMRPKDWLSEKLEQSTKKEKEKNSWNNF